MKVVDPGHIYELDKLDSYEKVRLVFVKRVGKTYPGNENVHPGTNMQEVIRALIDRCQYVDGQIESIHTKQVVVLLREALTRLETRAAERHGRVFNSQTHAIELLPTCKKCGHIGCGGECH